MPAGRSRRWPRAISRGRPRRRRNPPARVRAAGSDVERWRPEMELHERLRTPNTTVDEANDPFAAVKNRIHQVVITELGPQLFRDDMDPVKLRSRVLTAIRTELAAEQGISLDDRERLVGEIADDTLAHGPIEKLLADESVTEIMVNGPREVWV